MTNTFLSIWSSVFYHFELNVLYDEDDHDKDEDDDQDEDEKDDDDADKKDDDKDVDDADREEKTKWQLGSYVVKQCIYVQLFKKRFQPSRCDFTLLHLRCLSVRPSHIIFR